MSISKAEARLLEVMANNAGTSPDNDINDEDSKTFANMMSKDPRSTSAQNGANSANFVEDGTSIEMKSDDRQWKMTATDEAGNNYEWGMDAKNNFYVSRNGSRILDGVEADDDQIKIQFSDGGVSFMKDNSHLAKADITFEGRASVTSLAEGARNADHGQLYLVSSRGALPFSVDSYIESEESDEIPDTYDVYSPDLENLTNEGPEYNDVHVRVPIVADGSPAATLQKYFETEGDSPYVDDNTLRFDALQSAHVTPNGNGLRNELKISEDQRVAMSETYEALNANITANLSKGSKTIIAQHHASDTGTLMKVYVSDTAESGLINSKADDGIFDVYVRMANPGGGETKYALGTIQSGDSFELSILNDHGDVTVSAFGQSVSQTVKDSTASYLKIGNYHQAQDSVTGKDVSSSSKFAEFFASKDISQSEIFFSDIEYMRETA